MNGELDYLVGLRSFLFVLAHFCRIFIAARGYDIIRTFFIFLIVGLFRIGFRIRSLFVFIDGPLVLAFDAYSHVVGPCIRGYRISIIVDRRTIGNIYDLIELRARYSRPWLSVVLVICGIWHRNLIVEDILVVDYCAVPHIRLRRLGLKKEHHPARRRFNRLTVFVVADNCRLRHHSRSIAVDVYSSFVFIIDFIFHEFSIAYGVVSRAPVFICYKSRLLVVEIRAGLKSRLRCPCSIRLVHLDA